MFDYLSLELIMTAIIFAVVSIGVCLGQITLRRKVNFLGLCKVTVYVPVLSILIKILMGNAHSLMALSEANDLSRSMILQGVATMLSTLAFGIVITIVLAFVYTVTEAFVINKK